MLSKPRTFPPQPQLGALSQPQLGAGATTGAGALQPQSLASTVPQGLLLPREPSLLSKPRTFPPQPQLGALSQPQLGAGATTGAGALQPQSLASTVPQGLLLPREPSLLSKPRTFPPQPQLGALSQPQLGAGATTGAGALQPQSLASAVPQESQPPRLVNRPSKPPLKMPQPQRSSPPQVGPQSAGAALQPQVGAGTGVGPQPQSLLPQPPPRLPSRPRSLPSKPRTGCLHPQDSLTTGAIAGAGPQPHPPLDLNKRPPPQFPNKRPGVPTHESLQVSSANPHAGAGDSQQVGVASHPQSPRPSNRLKRSVAFDSLQINATLHSSVTAAILTFIETRLHRVSYSNR